MVSIKSAHEFVINIDKGIGEVDGKTVKADEEPNSYWTDLMQNETLELDNPSILHIISIMADKGDYCVAGFKNGRGFAITDMLGSRPIFLSRRRMLISNRVRFMRNIMEDKVELLPGSSSVRCEEGRATIRKISEKARIKPYKSLEELLELSVKERLKGIRKVALAFSGGLDSSVLAFLVKKRARPALFTLKAGKGRDDMAEKGSQLLDIQLHYVEVDEQSIREAFKSITSSVIWKGPMDYAIALGFQIVAKKASEEGYGLLFAGQGADELFGGYRKYLLKENDPSTLALMLRNDAKKVYVGAARDAEAIRDGNCIPSFPYMDERIAIYSEMLPLNMKVHQGVGKIALRKCAERLGLDERICKAPKKAFQYSSGMQKLVHKLFF